MMREAFEVIAALFIIACMWYNWYLCKQYDILSDLYKQIYTENQLIKRKLRNKDML